MAKFAVIDNENVINTIQAESKQLAEELTGYSCIEFTNEPAEPNGFYINGSFVQAQPFPSWSLDRNTLIWESPVPYPQDNKNYYWDESTISWVEIEKSEQV